MKNSGVKSAKSRPQNDMTLVDWNYGKADDWRGLTDPVERRRRQNRLNQRAYRNRRLDENFSLKDSHRVIKTTAQDQIERQILEGLMSTALQSYSQGRPNTDHLLSLTRVNTYRAFVNNIHLLGLSMDGLCAEDVLSPFTKSGPAQFPPKVLPSSLCPTPTQHTWPHHPWLDFFPHPRVRDNLIRAQDRYDEDELCLDVLGFWNPDAIDNMLIVWGDPLHPENWEVTEGFVKKWGWVLFGCPEILQYTNHWRIRRGEPPILRYL